MMLLLKKIVPYSSALFRLAAMDPKVYIDFTIVMAIAVRI